MSAVDSYVNFIKATEFPHHVIDEWKKIKKIQFLCAEKESISDFQCDICEAMCTVSPENILFVNEDIDKFSIDKERDLIKNLDFHKSGGYY